MYYTINYSTGKRDRGKKTPPPPGGKAPGMYYTINVLYLASG